MYDLHGPQIKLFLKATPRLWGMPQINKIDKTRTAASPSYTSTAVNRAIVYGYVRVRVHRRDTKCVNPGKCISTITAGSLPVMPLCEALISLKILQCNS